MKAGLSFIGDAVLKIIFDILSFTAEDFVVNAGVEFFANAALKLILDEIVFILQNLMDVMVGILDNLLELDLLITEVTNGYQIEDFNFKIYREDLSIIIELGSGRLILGNMVDTSEIKSETLSILNGDALFGLEPGLIAILHTTAMYAFIVSVPILRAIGNPSLMIGTFFAQLLGQLTIFAGGTINGITDPGNEFEDREAFKTVMAFTYLSLAISSLLLMVDYKGVLDKYRATMTVALWSSLLLSLPGIIATGDPTSNAIGSLIDEAFSGIMHYIRNLSGIPGLKRDISFVAGLHTVYYFFMFIVTMFVNP